MQGKIEFFLLMELQGFLMAKCELSVEPSKVRHTSCHGDHRFTREWCRAAGYEGDADELVALFDSHGLTCDCEIVYNADPEVLCPDEETLEQPPSSQVH